MKFLRALLFVLPLMAVSCMPPVNAAFAQQAVTPAPAKVEEAPKLSTTEVVAIGAINEKLQANAKERANYIQVVRSIEDEIAKEHPGYHFDENTGQIAKDAAPEKPADAPAKAVQK